MPEAPKRQTPQLSAGGGVGDPGEPSPAVRALQLSFLRDQTSWGPPKGQTPQLLLEGRIKDPEPREQSKPRTPSSARSIGDESRPSESGVGAWLGARAPSAQRPSASTASLPNPGPAGRPPGPRGFIQKVRG